MVVGNIVACHCLDMHGGHQSMEPGVTGEAGTHAHETWRVSYLCPPSSWIDFFPSKALVLTFV